jgi:hypothetical protein
LRPAAPTSLAIKNLRNKLEGWVRFNSRLMYYQVMIIRVQPKEHIDMMKSIMYNSVGFRQFNLHATLVSFEQKQL